MIELLLLAVVALGAFLVSASRFKWKRPKPSSGGQPVRAQYSNPAPEPPRNHLKDRAIHEAQHVIAARYMGAASISARISEAESYVDATALPGPEADLTFLYAGGVDAGWFDSDHSSADENEAAGVLENEVPEDEQEEVEYRCREEAEEIIHNHRAEVEEVAEVLMRTGVYEE